MCSNYHPVTRADRLLSFFGVERDRHERPPEDVFPSGLAPMIILAPDDGTAPRRAMALEDAIFRLVPDFIAKVECPRSRTTPEARRWARSEPSASRGRWGAAASPTLSRETIW